ncbi:predicted protein [Nematostella vectensis]|uniref:Uncharacterized protein n=1 Tax=Nematostella vectensis TaxID=45351 RepID=A7RUV4_NEMVE|nr:uncharacterized protein C7orf57 homolog [Nematostella vectensis]EDO44759.1 predicted protein [Nematostella vectensis]|eukprot:XP_001636822.1 predicted protein [Nematostella vectensis]
MANQRATSDWYYDAPSYNQSPVSAPPASQIPGLSHADNLPLDLDEQNFSKKKGLVDTDSEYIRLAKAGGQKGLLSMDKQADEYENKPKHYNRVNWFDHVHADNEEIPVDRVFQSSKRHHQQSGPHQVLPDWFAHDHSNEETPTRPQKQSSSHNPISQDNLSAWQRQNTDDTRFSRKKH